MNYDETTQINQRRFPFSKRKAALESTASRGNHPTEKITTDNSKGRIKTTTTVL
jgi:hypothetical protein